jgi:hypothetical protein
LNTNLALLEIVPEETDLKSKFRGSVAAIVHIFYDDLAAELFEKVSLIPGKVDLFVTTDTQPKANKIRKIYKATGIKNNRFTVRVVKSNRGRDLSAYFIECKDVIYDDDYDLIVKIHSKKTAQSGRVKGEFFKNQQIDNLLLSSGYVQNIFNLFEADPLLGIVFPPMIHIGFPTIGHAWFSNKAPAQKYAKEIGIDVKIRVVEWATFISRFIKTGDFNVVLLGWGLGVEPDQYNIWHSSQQAPGQFNFIGYQNKKVDHLLEKGRLELNPDKRMKIYHDFAEILLEDSPIVYLFAGYGLPTMHKRIKGIDNPAPPAGIGHNAYEWFIPKPYRRNELSAN